MLENMIRLVRAAYENTRTAVKTAQGQTEPFEIKVSLHQGSALSPFLFVVIPDTTSEGFRKGMPWELLFADDLVVMAERHVQGHSEQKVKASIVDCSNVQLKQVDKVQVPRHDTQ